MYMYIYTHTHSLQNAYCTFTGLVPFKGRTENPTGSKHGERVEGAAGVAAAGGPIFKSQAKVPGQQVRRVRANGRLNLPI